MASGAAGSRWTAGAEIHEHGVHGAAGAGGRLMAHFMALVAVHVTVLAGEREPGARIIEARRRLPLRLVVAVGTGPARAAPVLVQVAGRARFANAEVGALHTQGHVVPRGAG